MRVLYQSEQVATWNESERRFVANSGSTAVGIFTSKLNKNTKHLRHEELKTIATFTREWLRVNRYNNKVAEV